MVSGTKCDDYTTINCETIIGLCCVVLYFYSTLYDIDIPYLPVYGPNEKKIEANHKNTR
jgi:hypothetical protein